MENGSRISGEKSSDKCRSWKDDEGGEAVCRRALDGGKPQPKKGQDFSQSFSIRSFHAGVLRSCLWNAYREETRSVGMGLFLTIGRIPSL
jgi:hypothetical protein